LLTVLAGVFIIADKKSAGYIILPSILLFVFMYVLKNIRRPMNVGYISEQISHRTMASGLSVESLVKTLVAAPLAPAVGWIADTYGVGIALAVLGAAMVSVYPIAHVR